MMTWKMPPINFWLLSTSLDEYSPQFDSFLSVCMMVTAYSFVQHTVTHDYSVLTSIMKFNWKQTKTHSEKQKEVLELENTLFSTKNACKEWPIRFLIWSINFLNGPLEFWGRGHGPILVKNLSLSLFMARCTSIHTTLCDTGCQWLVTGRWFSQSTPPVSPHQKNDRHDITAILLKVTLNTINQPNQNQQSLSFTNPVLKAWLTCWKFAKSCYLELLTFK